MKNFLKNLSHFMGLERSYVSHHEKFISAIGGFISIVVIILISQYFLGQDNFWLLVPSMGASAVLLFAVPHGPLSQPWPLIGGHFISAIIGVTCALIISDQIIAISSSVGLSILAMYYLNCIHPPGGATALSAVLATNSVHSLGYEFIITPVFLNTMSIFFIAILFNSFFNWRRYPAFLSQNKRFKSKEQQEFFNHDDFLSTMKKIDSFVDVNEYDLKRIFELANISDSSKKLVANDIKAGCYYSNGKHGKDWSIRQVVEESSKNDLIVFKQVVGGDKVPDKRINKSQFAHWAKYEIIKKNGQWMKKSQ